MRRSARLGVLQTPARFYPYVGGVENHVYYLSKALIRQGYDVKVICSNEPKLSASGHVDGIRVERLKYLFKIANTNITLGLPLRLMFDKYDVAHTHMPTPWTSDWTVLIAKMRHKKAVITIHNDMDKPGRWGGLMTGVYMKTLFRVTLLLVDRIIIVNPHWQDTLIKTRRLYQPYANKISTIPNGVDTSLFVPSPAPIRKPGTTILFVSILDRHHRFKGFDYLLEALPQIIAEVPGVRLEVIGDGSLRREYIEDANRRGLIKFVDFLGAKSQSDLVSFYQSADVFVLPSTEIEGFGIVLLEAMACGIPVIATSIAGVSAQIAKNNAGHILDPHNTDSLAEAIVAVLKNPAAARQMGQRGRDLAVRSYSWQHVSDKVSSLYEGITK